MVLAPVGVTSRGKAGSRANSSRWALVVPTDRGTTQDWWEISLPVMGQQKLKNLPFPSLHATQASPGTSSWARASASPSTSTSPSSSWTPGATSPLHWTEEGVKIENQNAPLSMWEVRSLTQAFRIVQACKHCLQGILSLQEICRGFWACPSWSRLVSLSSASVLG